MWYVEFRLYVILTYKRLYEMATLKPPFRANDMKGLYNKIIKGVYDPISSFFSADL